MTPMIDLKKRRFFASAFTVAILAAMVLAASFPAQATASTLKVVVRPVMAGDIYVNGVIADGYPYTFVITDGTIPSILAVAKPRDPAKVLLGGPATYFAWSKWKGTYTSNYNPMNNWGMYGASVVFAEFSSQLGVASGVVWNDANKNGIKDNGEAGLAGWGVQLRDAATGAVVSEESTMPAQYNEYYSTGSYALAAQEPGNYYLTFTLQPGYITTDRHIGGDAAVWSEPYHNAYPAAVPAGQEPDRSAQFSLNLKSLGGSDLTMNAGYYLYPHNVVPDTAKQMSETNPDLVFLDVRETAEYDLAHIPCSLNRPLNSGNLADTIVQLRDQIGLDATIVTVSNAGYRSTVAAKYLSQYGFTNVYNMVPGLDSWRWKKLATGEAYPVANAGTDQTVNEGKTCNLDGSQSSNFNIKSYKWEQLSGPEIVLSDPAAPTPTFFVPSIAANQDARFKLTVTAYSSMALPASSEVTVHLKDNGITDYSSDPDIIPFLSLNGKHLGVKVTGGTIVRLNVSDPAAITATTNRPDGMPYGIFDWAVRTNTPGGTAYVSFYFPVAQDWWNTWVKYNSKGVWSDYGDHAVWDTTFTMLTLTVTDNGIGDDDNSTFENSIITDPGGLGYYRGDIVDTPPDTTVSDETTRGDDSGTSKGCFISALGL